jgi:recombination protein RecT
MNTIGNAVQQRQQQQQRQPSTNLVQVVQRMQPEIERALPKHLNADRMARLGLTVMRQSQMAKEKGIAKSSLMDCTPESFVASLLTAAALGLEPGTNGEAYLVPYWDNKAKAVECQLIIGYQGIAKLFWQHPLAKHVDAQAVYSNDTFDYEHGLEPFLRHRPAKGDRGEVIYYYAVAALNTGASKFEVLSVDEVKALRGGKTGSNGNVPDPQHWMERKTALKQVLKLMPKSTQLISALTVDEQVGSQLAAVKAPEAIADRDEPVAEIEATAPEAVPENIDPVTGEVHDGEDWPQVAQPGGAR